MYVILIVWRVQKLRTIGVRKVPFWVKYRPKTVRTYVASLVLLLQWVNLNSSHQRKWNQFSESTVTNFTKNEETGCLHRGTGPNTSLWSVAQQQQQQERSSWLRREIGSQSWKRLWRTRQQTSHRRTQRFQCKQTPPVVLASALVPTTDCCGPTRTTLQIPFFLSI